MTVLPYLLASFITCGDFAGSIKPHAERARLEKGIEI